MQEFMAIVGACLVLIIESVLIAIFVIHVTPCGINEDTYKDGYEFCAKTGCNKTICSDWAKQPRKTYILNHCE